MLSTAFDCLYRNILTTIFCLMFYWDRKPDTFGKKLAFDLLTLLYAGLRYTITFPSLWNHQHKIQFNHL